MEREAALTDFDAARDAFLAALGPAPDEALSYLRTGDIYAIGGLAVHCNWVLKHYQRVLDRLAKGDGGEFRAVDPEGEHEAADRRALAGLAGAERAPELAELGTLHQSVKEAAARVPASAWETKTPIFYGDTVDAFPTSPDDVLLWLRDHYREHVPHAGELLAEWQAGRAQ